MPWAIYIPTKISTKIIYNVELLKMAKEESNFLRMMKSAESLLGHPTLLSVESNTISNTTYLLHSFLNQTFHYIAPKFKSKKTEPLRGLKKRTASS